MATKRLTVPRTNRLTGIEQNCRAFLLLVVMGSSSATWAQSASIATEQAPSALGSTKFTQVKKLDDGFLVLNNNHFSACTKRAAGVTSEILSCLSASVGQLDEYLSRLMIRRELNKEVGAAFLKNRESSCLKIANDFGGSNHEVVYADCLRMQTIEELIKKIHSVGDVDEFLLLLLIEQKVSLIEREKIFNSRNTFCANAAKFQADFLEKSTSDEGFYKNCLSTRTIKEILKKLN